MFEDQRHLLRNDYIHRIAVNSVFKKKKKIKIMQYILDLKKILMSQKYIFLQFIMLK